jgi:hypothetical protein
MVVAAKVRRRRGRSGRTTEAGDATGAFANARRARGCIARTADGNCARFFSRAAAEPRDLSGGLGSSFSVCGAGGARLRPRFPAGCEASSTFARAVLVRKPRLRSDHAWSSSRLGKRASVGRTLRARQARAIRSANRRETGGLGFECTATGGMARAAASKSGRSSTRTGRPREPPGSTGSQRPITRPANVNPASRSAAAETNVSADLSISIPLIASPQLLGSRRSRASYRWVGSSWP